MLTFFETPALLLFLALLPVLWWLLRLTPPSPKKILFPALMLLQGLAPREETPARAPWWLLALRLLIVVLVILAFASLHTDRRAGVVNEGALLIAVDNDWAAARDWPERQKLLDHLVRDAARQGRKLYLLPTTPSADGAMPDMSGPLDAEAASARLQILKPQPWGADWLAANVALARTDTASVVDVAWLASGLGNQDALKFLAALKNIAPVRALGTASPIYALSPPAPDADKPELIIYRASTSGVATVHVKALAKDGNKLGQLMATFTDGAPRAVVTLDLPADARNRLARFEIDGQRTAAGTVLLDAAWEHRRVGIVGDTGGRPSLLDDVYYLERALKPFADIQRGSLADLIGQKVGILFVPDLGGLDAEQMAALEKWVQRGGILVRFAGEKMAAKEEGDALLPVALRSGGRALGGAMSWAVPQKLRAFAPDSPFHGLPVPDDVAVSRQVLAEPDAALASHVWSMLADSTPLVTAKTAGQGTSVLFHIPARSDWSNLPLSGLFVDMLRRLVDLSRGDPAAIAATTLQPLRILDAFGDERTLSPLVEAWDTRSAMPPSPRHPPGLYGTATLNVAFNLGVAVGQPEALRGVTLEAPQFAASSDSLKPWLLLAAFGLFLVDFIVSLFMRGFLRLPARVAALIFVVLLTAQPAQAADDRLAIELTSRTTLAYMRTGDREVDRTSEYGLRGLAIALQNRTSLFDVGVAAVDADSDLLPLFPLIYWPVTATQTPLSSRAAARVGDYLQHGGMILFDASGEADPVVFLHRVLAGVDMPPLVKLPEQHVLKRTFYLLDDFPGRFTGHDFWLEPESASAYDGVASVLVGGHAWAAAWAVDDGGKPLFPCTPNGEAQRERAYRFGVNLVMYALTGNYKADQVHAATLLQRGVK